MPTIFAMAAREIRQKYARLSESDLEARARVMREPYTDDGRAAALRPIEARMKERYDTAAADLRKYADQAMERYQKHRPATLQRRAAFTKPERAAALRALAMGMSGEELLEMARMATEAKDDAAAYGVRLALADTIKASPESFEAAGAIYAELDKGVASETEAALADLVGAQVEFGRFELGGVYVDAGSGLIANPLAALTNARRAATIPLERGQTRELPDAEVDRLCELAGVPTKPAGAAA